MQLRYKSFRCFVWTCCLQWNWARWSSEGSKDFSHYQERSMCFIFYRS